jgi:hypothetical protein
VRDGWWLRRLGETAKCGLSGKPSGLLVSLGHGVPKNRIDEIEHKLLPLTRQLTQCFDPRFEFGAWAGLASVRAVYAEQFVDGNFQHLCGLLQKLGARVLGAAFIVGDHLAGQAHQLRKARLGQTAELAQSGETLTESRLWFSGRTASWHGRNIGAVLPKPGW